MYRNNDEKCKNYQFSSLSSGRFIVYNPVQHTYIQLGRTVGQAFADGKKLGLK